MKKLILFFLSVLFSNILIAQNRIGYTEQDYAAKPLWVQMMNDTLANYYEVEKAYTIYWRHHELPKDEEEEMERKSAPNIKKDIKKEEEHEELSKEKQLERIESFKLALDVKRYRIWKIENRPYVKHDGSIMPLSERLKLWREQNRIIK